MSGTVNVDTLVETLDEGLMRCPAHSMGAVPTTTCPACVTEQVLERALSDLAARARERDAAVKAADGMARALCDPDYDYAPNPHWPEPEDNVARLDGAR